MWSTEEIEQIYKNVFSKIENESIEDYFLAEDIEAIKKAGTAIQNIGNRIFQPKVRVDISEMMRIY